MQHLGDLPRARVQRMRGAPACDDGDDPEPRRRHVEGGADPDEFDARRVESDLLGGLAHRSGARVLAGLDPAAGEGELSGV